MSSPSDKQAALEQTWRNFSPESMLSATPREKVQYFLDIFKHPSFDFFDHVVRKVRLIDASEGRAEFEITVTRDMCNTSGTLHGGCAATLMDDLTSAPALTIAKPGFLDGGTLSRTLSCTYLRAPKVGDKLRVVCEVVSVGRTMCHFRGDMIMEDGRVAVSCTHDKVPRHREKGAKL